LCDLQSTNIRDYAANVFPPKSNFSEDHILLRPQIFTRARESPSLTSAPPPGMGAPLQLFSKRGKYYLKMQ